MKTQQECAQLLIVFYFPSLQIFCRIIILDQYCQMDSTALEWLYYFLL